VVLVLVLVYLCPAQEEEACITEVDHQVDHQKGLLQMKRMRDQLSIGEATTLTDRNSLLEMKAQLADKLDRGEQIKSGEKGFLHDFREWIKNTSLQYIKDGARETKNLTDTDWNEVLNCDSTLADDQEDGTWNRYKREKDDAKQQHELCRQDDEAPAWRDANQSCNALDDWVKSLRDPTDQHGAYPDDGSPEDIAKWLDDFWKWHCSGDLNKEDKFKKMATEECKPDMENAENKHITCNGKQADFEEKFCKFKGHVETECKKYNKCRTDKEKIYNATVTKFHTLDKDRKVEWQILHVIICYIGLLLGDGDEMTEANKKNCEDQSYPFPPDSEVSFPGTNDDGSLIPGFNQSKCSLTEPDPVVPAPCEQQFILDHYKNLATPATTCGLTKTCSVAAECVVQAVGHMCMRSPDRELLNGIFTFSECEAAVNDKDGSQFVNLAGVWDSISDSCFLFHTSQGPCNSMDFGETNLILLTRGPCAV